MIVKAGICVAYDWHLLEHSLPTIYDYVEEICLSVDAERKSWNGNEFEIDWPAFLEIIRSIDKENKISILEKSFYNEKRTPIQNECFQRTCMAEVLGDADWIVQIDADEIIVNPEKLKAELIKNSKIGRPVNIHGMWINLIKETNDGFVYSVLKTPPLATNSPVYEYGRTNGHFNIYTNTFLIHITWARPQEEVAFKLKNWGHSDEFTGDGFLKLWKVLDESNWMFIKNFHPMQDFRVKELFHVKTASINHLIKDDFYKKHFLKKKELLLNNIWLSRLDKIIKNLK